MILKKDGSLSYTVRRSGRAKHVRLKITRTHGLEVVVPKNFNMEWLPPILEKRDAWIRNAAKKLNVLCEAGPECSLVPESIVLRSLNEEYRVVVLPQHEIASRIIDADKLIRMPGGVLALELECRILLPKEIDESGQAELLRLWLLRSGRDNLEMLLAREAERVRISYSKVQVRMQKSRWGSCSSNGNISLNARLLLLPFELTRYIFLHELAHREQPNHSANYWKYLTSLEPETAILDARMRDAWKYIPRCFAM